MKKAYIVWNKNFLKGKICDIQEEERGHCYYFNCVAEEPSELTDLLERNGISQHPQSGRDKVNPNTFIKEYINLIGEISTDNAASRLWWATDISSKNRFTSRLPALLDEFLKVMQAIDREDVQCMFILSPSEVIVESIKRFCLTNNIAFESERRRLRNCMVCFKGRFCKILSVAFHSVRLWLRSRYAKNYLGHHYNNIGNYQKIYFVVRTFVYNHSFADNDTFRDPFFGRLPEFLRQQRETVIFADFLGNFKSCLKKVVHCPNFVIFPFEYFLTLRNIMEALKDICLCHLNIRSELFFFNYNVSDLIKNELKRTFNGIAIYQYLHYAAVGNLLKKISADKFFMTYENNPWEKMSIIAIREKSPRTEIIGYQHAVIPQAAANMFISPKEIGFIPMPDRVLTTGEEPLRIMEEYGAIKGGEPACALRYEYLNKVSQSSRLHSGNILLALGGIVEVYEMVNYVLSQLKDDPRFHVIIRPHPVLPIDRLKRKLKYNIRKISNLEISKGISVQKDIERSDIVIYWGSTLALEALSMGKPVIHFNNGFILSYDPLFRFSRFKWVVSTNNSLSKVLEEIKNLSDEEFYKRQREARNYLRKYFYPVTDERLSKFI